MASSPRVCVVGGGIIGLATAYALKTGGAEVTCFEQAHPGAGQSGGLTRVFRHTHATAQRVRLAAVARKRWNAWETAFGRRLVGAEGTLVTGDSVERVAELFREAKIPYSLGRGALSSVLPIARPDNVPFLMDKSAGAIRPARALHCLRDALSSSYTQATVLGISVDEGVTVETNRGAWRGDHVVVCAGAQTAMFAASLGIQIPETRELHPQGYFRVRPRFARSPMPCLLERSGMYLETVYASPVGTTGLYSVGLSSDDNAIHVPQGSMAPDGNHDLSALRKRTVAYASHALPGLCVEPERFRACIVTKLGDDDAFDTWQHGPATFFAGHNVYKLAPLLGDLLAKAATTGTIPAELHNDDHQTRISIRGLGGPNDGRSRT